MTEEVKETVRRIFREAYYPLVEDVADKTGSSAEELFNEMINSHIGGWNFIYQQAQKSLDMGVSLGKQEEEVKKISQLFRKFMP